MMIVTNLRAGMTAEFTVMIVLHLFSLILPALAQNPVR
jgi:hypothetical protein